MNRLKRNLKPVFWFSLFLHSKLDAWQRDSTKADKVRLQREEKVPASLRHRQYIVSNTIA